MRTQNSLNDTLFKQAQKSIPGGVNSPVRAFQAVGGTPVFFKRAEGAYLYDVTGKAYVDYIGAWGPMLLGHGDEDVVAALQQTLTEGMVFGAPTEQETLLAEAICEYMPAIEKIRLVNSGTEATMTAIRLARGYTQRSLIIKFEGCYHGHADPLLVKAGSGALTFGQPSSAGIPKETTQHTINLTFNDVEQLNKAFTEYGDRVAAVIVEPVAANMGCVPPKPEFLNQLRAVCDEHGALLIFDEVITGFRVALGGAQALYQVRPDLTTLGKIIGGGLPIGAVGGKAEIMNHLAPNGPVYQAGTLSGNLLATCAGSATLSKLARLNPYDALAKTTTRLAQGFRELAQQYELPLQVNALPGLFSLFFNAAPVTTFKEVVTSAETPYFKPFFHSLLSQGIYTAPSPYECYFVSIRHDDAVVEKTLAAAQLAFQAAKAAS